MASRALRIGGYVVALAAVVAVDQAVKAAMRGLLSGGGSMTLIPGVMDLRLVFNGGAAFGMGDGGAWLYGAVAAAVLVASAVYVALGKPSMPLAVALGVVAGGGVGNLIDRVATGTVTDFFMPTFVDFAVFNVADIAITCGAVIAFLLFWRAEGARDKQDGGRS